MKEEAKDVESIAEYVTATDTSGSTDLTSAAGAITVGVARLEETRDEIRRLVEEEQHILEQLRIAMKALEDGE